MARQLAARAVITAGFSSGCFCPRPTFDNGPAFSTEPTFQFRKHAVRYAAAHGLTVTHWSKEKSASAELPLKCAHRDVQTVRLSWALTYR